MTLLDTIEANHSRSNARLHTKLILAAAAAVIVLSAIEFSSFGTKAHPRQLVDFDSLYIAGQWCGAATSTKPIIFAAWVNCRVLSRTEAFLPWTYPPQFDIFVALLALFSQSIAYSLFIAGSLAAYLATLRRIAMESFIPVLIVTFPALVITIRCGQNGFLTGALIGLPVSI